MVKDAVTQKLCTNCFSAGIVANMRMKINRNSRNWNNELISGVNALDGSKLKLF